MIREITVNFRKIFILIYLFILTITTVNAEQAQVNFQITLPSYFKIEAVSDTILTANITDDTGNLYSPLQSKFKVISNSNETKTIYLKADSITEDGLEPSMFQMGGRVYIAFTNVTHRPKRNALINCKMGYSAEHTAGVVAYPVNSISGAKYQYQRGLEKYKIFIENGITNLVVNIGTHVQMNSFGKNDPKGFYQATLSLTESDI